MTCPALQLSDPDTIAPLCFDQGQPLNTLLAFQGELGSARKCKFFTGTIPIGQNDHLKQQAKPNHPKHPNFPTSIIVTCVFSILWYVEKIWKKDVLQAYSHPECPHISTFNIFLFHSFYKKSWTFVFSLHVPTISNPTGRWLLRQVSQRNQLGGFLHGLGPKLHQGQTSTTRLSRVVPCLKWSDWNMEKSKTKNMS